MRRPEQTDCIDHHHTVTSTTAPFPETISPPPKEQASEGLTSDEDLGTLHSAKQKGYIRANTARRS